jgi:hypothetical protein
MYLISQSDKSFLPIIFVNSISMSLLVLLAYYIHCSANVDFYSSYCKMTTVMYM